MPNDADDALTLSDHAAQRLLERATALDANGVLRLSQLRASALEAGISAPAFDAALGELRGDASGTPPRVAPRWVRLCMTAVPDRRAAMVYYWIFATGSMLGPTLALIPGLHHPFGRVGLAAFVTLSSAGSLWSSWRAIRWLDRHGWNTLP